MTYMARDSIFAEVDLPVFQMTWHCKSCLEQTVKNVAGCLENNSWGGLKCTLTNILIFKTFFGFYDNKYIRTFIH